MTRSTHLVDTLAAKESVELGGAVLSGSNKGGLVGDLDLLVAEDLAGDGKGLVVGREDLCADLGVERLDQSLNADRGEEELVEAVVRGEEDLGRLLARGGRDIVGNKLEEASEELDLGLVGGRLAGSLLIVLVYGGGSIVVDVCELIVELLGENF